MKGLVFALLLLTSQVVHTSDVIVSVASLRNSLEGASPEAQPILDERKTTNNETQQALVATTVSQSGGITCSDSSRGIILPVVILLWSVMLTALSRGFKSKSETMKELLMALYMIFLVVTLMASFAYQNIPRIRGGLLWRSQADLTITAAMEGEAPGALGSVMGVLMGFLPLATAPSSLNSSRVRVAIILGSAATLMAMVNPQDLPALHYFGLILCFACIAHVFMNIIMERYKTMTRLKCSETKLRQCFQPFWMIFLSVLSLVCMGIMFILLSQGYVATGGIMEWLLLMQYGFLVYLNDAPALGHEQSSEEESAPDDESLYELAYAYDHRDVAASAHAASLMGRDPATVLGQQSEPSRRAQPFLWRSWSRNTPRGHRTGVQCRAGSLALIEPPAGGRCATYSYFYCPLLFDALYWSRPIQPRDSATTIDCTDAALTDTEACAESLGANKGRWWRAVVGEYARVFRQAGITADLVHCDGPTHIEAREQERLLELLPDLKAAVDMVAVRCSLPPLDEPLPHPAALRWAAVVANCNGFVPRAMMPPFFRRLHAIMHGPSPEADPVVAAVREWLPVCPEEWGEGRAQFQRILDGRSSRHDWDLW